MSWRDTPEIIWQDEDGDRLELSRGVLLRVSQCLGIRAAVNAPETVEGRTESLTRLAAVWGLDIEVSERPRSIEVGDIVTAEGRAGAHVVRAIDVDVALLRREIDSLPMVASLNKLRHAEPEPEPEAEVVWVEQGEIPYDEWCEMLAQAVEDGRRVEAVTDGGWMPTMLTSAGEFGYARSNRYRMEAPAPAEAPEPTACTEDHRLCSVVTPDWFRCREIDPDSGWRCSRSFGHDGPHVACATSMDEHNLASWGGDTR